MTGVAWLRRACSPKLAKAKAGSANKSVENATWMGHGVSDSDPMSCRADRGLLLEGLDLCLAREMAEEICLFGELGLWRLLNLSRLGCEVVA